MGEGTDEVGEGTDEVGEGTDEVVIVQMSTSSYLFPLSR